MKTKVSISLLTLCLLSIITSAQGYSIRVASNTNLRASNSLSASIVETVPAGTTLTVLGEVNRWLRISRDGREVWMASWVRHERVEGGVQTQSQTTSTVDNCCFVDRQCQSDQEWTDGYWAFQNMQCAVPSQSQVQATSSSPSADASQIDNCCQADRQCQTDEDWINGYYAFQNSQCVALVQTQPQTTSQPAVSSPAQIDNCCFAGWQCSTDQEWANGYTAYQNNQCASHSQSQVLNVDLSQVDNCCFVNLQCQTDQDWEHGYAAYKYYQCSTDIPMKIDGSNTFVALFRSAFNLLKERSPRLYAYGINGLDRIKMIQSGSSGILIDDRTYVQAPTNYITNFSDGTPITEGAVVEAVGGIIHEACHVHRWDAGLRESGWRNELPCIQVELQAYQAVDPGDRHGFGEWIQGFITNIRNPAYWWWADDD